MNRRTEFTLETHRLLVIRRRGGPVHMWCEGCLADVQMITPIEAAALTSVSSRIIYRWIEEGDIHFAERLGELLVCVNSLAAQKATINIDKINERKEDPMQRG